MSGALVTPERFDAALFDLDGVVTDTARVHALCWKRVFDGLLERRAKVRGESFRPFDLEADYPRYVDGKAWRDGVRDFLASRRIRLPEGSPDAAEAEDSVADIARREDALCSDTWKGRAWRCTPARFAGSSACAARGCGSPSSRRATTRRMALVYGFEGLRDHGGRARFRPALPRGWQRLRFRLRVRGSLLEVDLGQERGHYELLEGEALEIEHEGEPVRVEPGGGPCWLPVTPLEYAAS